MILHAALSDLIDAHNPDLFCLTETWIKPSSTSAELLNCTLQFIPNQVTKAVVPC